MLCNLNIQKCPFRFSSYTFFGFIYNLINIHVHTCEAVRRSNGVSLNRNERNQSYFICMLQTCPMRVWIISFELKWEKKEEKKNSCIKSPFIPIWSLWELKAKRNFIHIPTILELQRCLKISLQLLNLKWHKPLKGKRKRNPWMCCYFLCI